MLINIAYGFLMLIVLFVFGLIADYPEQRRKQRRKACAKGAHHYGPWHYDYTIGYNDKDVYRHRCKYCGHQQFTISRLYPNENNEVYDQK